MCTSRLMRKSLLPTFGAPPSTSMPPGVSSRGAMMSSGIGLRVVEQRAEREGRHRRPAAALAPRACSGGPLRSTCSAPQPLAPPASAAPAASAGAAWRRCTGRSPPSLVGADAAVVRPGGCSGRWRRWRPRSASSRPAPPSRTGVVSTSSMRRACRPLTARAPRRRRQRRHRIDALGEVAEIDLERGLCSRMATSRWKPPLW